MPVELVVGVLANTAGVQHDNVGIVDAIGRNHALFGKEAGDPLRIVLVHLAPERAHEEPSRLVVIAHQPTMVRPAATVAPPDTGLGAAEGATPNPRAGPGVAGRTLARSRFLSGATERQSWISRAIRARPRAH